MPEILASGMTLGNEPNLRHLDTMPPLPASTGRRLIDKIMDDGILTELLELTDDEAHEAIDRARGGGRSRRSGASCMSSSTPCRTRSSPAIAASRARHSQQAEGPRSQNTVRLVETMHDGAVAVVTPDGAVVAHSGDIDQPFYLRSAAKPFQAPRLTGARRRAGASELALPVLPTTGIRCTSGWWSRCWPVGLGEADLRVPASWPLSDAAANVSGSRWGVGGHEPLARLLQACGWLRPAMPVAGRSTATWHPIIRFRWSSPTWSPICGFSASPVGVDGCGRPSIARRPVHGHPLFPPRLACGSGRSSTPCTGIRPWSQAPVTAMPR